MKENLERYQERLSDAERDALWRNLRNLPGTPASHHRITGRRWTLSFGTAIAAIAVVGIATALIVHFAEKGTNGVTVELLGFGELAGISRPAGSCQLVALDPELSSRDLTQSRPFGLFTGNPFVSTDENPVSTFAVDTDASSYVLARSHIEGGNLPPMDAVRVEEFLNFFHQGYPDFTAPDFRIFGEGAPSPFGKGYDLLRVGLKARQAGPVDRIPTQLVFVIDLSDSPADEGRLAAIKGSLRTLVDHLNPADRIGIVTSGGSGHTLLTPCGIDQRAAICRAVDAIKLETGRDTDKALHLSYAMAERADIPHAMHAIVLCSRGGIRLGEDGIVELLDRVRQQAEEGRFLTTVDLGMEAFNDLLLELLADRGGGRYFYVDTMEEANRIFANNLLESHQTVASDARVEVTFDPDRVTQYRLIGFERREAADDGGRAGASRIGAGQEITALYEVKLAEDAIMGPVASVRVRYNGPEGYAMHASERREIEETVEMADMRLTFEDASPRFRLAATVTEFAEVLRHSYWARGSQISDLVPMVCRLAGEMEDDPQVNELAFLIEKAAELSKGNTSAPIP